jgi:kinesin family member 18/19
MLGDDNRPGIMALSLEELFLCIEKQVDSAYKVKFSYLEIYNEMIIDLFNYTGEILDLREDPNKGLTVAGLSQSIAVSPATVIKQLRYEKLKFMIINNWDRYGNMHRTQETTGANACSSRSHAILQITVESKDKYSGIEAEIKVGKLSLIDLAGSERAARTYNRGTRLIEGANINRSLLALGNCINALSDRNTKNIKGTFIPYRDSKLTRLLKDSLGGNCRTVMITNISSSSNNFEDTHNSLKYANRAKEIKTNVNKNIVNVQFHITQYSQIISQLKQEIKNLKRQLNNKNNISKK